MSVAVDQLNFTFISGGYTVTLGGTSLGQIEDGIRFSYSKAVEEIRGDNFGDTTQDAVMRGVSGYMTIDFTLTEWGKVLSSYWFLGTVFGVMDAGIIGSLLSTKSAALVLTAVANTPAAAGAPSFTTATFTNAVLAPGFNVSHLLAPRLRRIPLQFVALPFTASSVNKFFTLA
jgi:hypothetical protein